MSLHDVRDTLGAILVGSGFAAVFVIVFFLSEVVIGLTSKDRCTQLNRGCLHANCVLL
jgi:hypothetical protein